MTNILLFFDETKKSYFSDWDFADLGQVKIKSQPSD
jgi:hypothetical protein